MINFLFISSVILSVFLIPGNLYIQAAISLFLLFLIASNVFSRRYSINRLQSNSVMFFSFWLFLSIISIFWVEDVEGWIVYTIVLFIAWTLNLVIVFNKGNQKVFKQVVSIVLISNIIHNLIGWFEVMTQIYMFSSSDIVYAAQLYRNPLSFFTNTNDFAFYLLFSMLFIFYLVPFKNKFNKFILMVSNIFLLYTTDSRAMYIAFLIGVVCIIILSINRNIIRNLLVIVLFIIIGIALTILSGTGYNIPEILNNSDAIRLNLIKNGMEFLNDNFWLGIGAGNGPFYLENNAIFTIYGQIQFHNWWIEILVLFGVPFFIYYLINYLYLIFINYSKIKISNIYKMFFVWLIVFIIGGISSSTIFTRIWPWIVFSTIFNFNTINRGDVT